MQTGLHPHGIDSVKRWAGLHPSSGCVVAEFLERHHYRRVRRRRRRKICQEFDEKVQFGILVTRPMPPYGDSGLRKRIIAVRENGGVPRTALDREIRYRTHA